MKITHTGSTYRIVRTKAGFTTELVKHDKAKAGTIVDCLESLHHETKLRGQTINN